MSAENDTAEDAEESADEADDEEQTGSSGPLITEEELRERSEDETFTEIAESLDVTPSTISYYARKYGIESTGTSQTYEGTEVDDPEWLEEQYHGNNLSMQEVGDLVGCSDGTVMRYMRKHDITPRQSAASGTSEPGPFQIVESVNGVGPAKLGALEERGLESDEDVAELPVMSDAGDEDAEPGLAETHGWSEDLAEAVLEQLEVGEPAGQDDDESDGEDDE